ncbi:MAG: DUF502 domain-containing protein [Halobacteriota archaeon]
MTNWKRDFVSGLIVLVPLIVTIWVAAWLFSFIAGAPIFGIIEEDILRDAGIDPAIAGTLRIIITLVAFALLVFAVGYLMRTAAGQYLESKVDNLVNRVPGVRVVYNASKLAIETALGEDTALQTPVKVEPTEGFRMTAFKTGNRTSDGREVIFLPTSPNITSGLVLEVPPEHVIETDEQVEQALTRVLSAGFGESNQTQHFIREAVEGAEETDQT